MNTPPLPSRRALLAGAAVLPLAVDPAAAAPGASALQIAGPGAPGWSAERLLVTSFGAVPDGRFDNSQALAAATRAALALGKELVFPAGTYAHSAPLHIGHAGLRLRGEGTAILRYTGMAGPCVVADPGPNTILYNQTIENLVIDGGDAGTIGLLSRNMAHSVRRNVVVRNVGETGFVIQGDVLSLYDSCRVSANERAFTRIPRTNWEIGNSPAISATTACTFLNCLAETASQTGWVLNDASANLWLGGTSEGLGKHSRTPTRAVGLRLGPKATGNSFQSFFCELNDGGDLILEGRDNLFANCTFSSRAEQDPYDSTKSVVVTPGAVGNRFEGGTAYAIQISRGATSTALKHMELLYRATDQGTGTVIEDCRQLYNSATRFPSRTVGNVEDPNPLALDWYEEVQFVPRLLLDGRALRVSEATGIATRIGNVVQFALSVRINARADNGALELDGLPFASTRKLAQIAGRGLLALADGTSIEIDAQTSAGEPRLHLATQAGNADQAMPVTTQIAPGTKIALSGTYFAS